MATPVSRPTAAPIATPAATPKATPASSPVNRPATSPVANPTATPVVDQQGPTPEAVNQVLGIKLFGNVSLWNSPDVATAKKLKLKQESSTDVQSAFQYFNKNEDASICGARYFSIYMRGEQGKVSQVTVMFANKGNTRDFATELEAHLRQTKQIRGSTMQMKTAMTEEIRHDEDQIRATLTGLFGSGHGTSLGQAAGMREQGTVWNWRDVSFFLEARRGEFVELKILPSSYFAEGHSDRAAFEKTKALIPNRILRRPNGDVIVTEVPMIDIGTDVSSTAPASIERLLRYYGIQGDMRTLTLAANSNSLKNLFLAIDPLLNSSGTRIIYVSGGRISDFRSYIDRGQPVITNLGNASLIKRRLKERMAKRTAVTDWAAWKNNGLTEARNNVRELSAIPQGQIRMQGYTCLVTGYNERTGEIAISNPWGPAYNEGWLTQEEIQAVVQKGGGGAITW